MRLFMFKENEIPKKSNFTETRISTQVIYRHLTEIPEYAREREKTVWNIIWECKEVQDSMACKHCKTLQDTKLWNSGTSKSPHPFDEGGPAKKIDN